MRSIRPRGRGAIVVSILIVSMFLFTVVTSLLILANSSLARSKNRVLTLEAQYAAESGADAAVAQLNAASGSSYAGTAGSEIQVMKNTLYKATYQTTVVDGATNNEKVVTSTGKVYRSNKPGVVIASRKIEVTSSRSVGSTSSAMLSRNIIDVGSGIKYIKGKDIFVNGYISMQKNVNILKAENITVAGKNTGTDNCSIGGSGGLEKASSFSTAGQNKTKLKLAYNNCITPPGNSTNSDFEVSANQNNISKVQSTYIPWSQFMDSSYGASYNGCNDWTTGISPRSIPSTGHAKQTHYPDSASNVSTSCGTSGDLALGSSQYNITDNVHIRASLCAASACTPTFYNPSATTRYIFVEGTVNFDSVQTASGSGPLVLISYGADPASKSSVCPYGGAIFVGNSGTTTAPKMYFLANNGLCFYQTKFGADPAIGGLSGKNISVSTNSGTPFDLSLDTSFPTGSVPVDLAWHAAHYRRL